MGTDLRTALGNAMASGKVEAPAPAPAAPAAPAPAAEASAPAAPAPSAASSTVSRDESGRFAPKGSDALSEPVAAATEAPKSTATPPKYRPPQSWKPAIREKWGALPEDVQEEIDRAEKAAADRIRRAAEAEKGYGAFRQAITPFEAQLRASGKAIPEALSDALALHAKVRNGSPQERAAALADVIAEATAAGVGVDAIDQALAQRLGGQAQPAKPQEFRDPRFDAFLSQLQQRERAKTAQTIAEFAKTHEFFGDVEDKVAGLIEAGIARDLPTAYDMAILLVPEIREVVEQRKQAEAARTSSQATERAQNAASSVRASPVVAGGSAPVGLRDQLAAAMSGSRR